MLVANSFDLWQKDAFFSAAEEVQQSADIVESAYRTWLRGRREGLMPQHLDELVRELQMALGTAKWQLEEFEKAVRLSYGNNSDDITITRHKQFVSAIDDQISRIETALKESVNVEGNKPFRWVNLDEEECDDLALFLSGTPQRIKSEARNVEQVVTSSLNESNTEQDCSFGSETVSSKVHTPNHGMSSVEVLVSNEDVNCELQASNSISCQDDQITSSNRRAWISPNGTGLEIVIDSDNRQKNALTEVTPKEKGFKPFFWRSRGEKCAGAKITMMNWINQHLRGRHRSQRQQISPVLPLYSIRFILALMLTVFLVVPFLVYST